MKLNATTEMEPITWPGVRRHPPVRPRRPGRGLPRGSSPTSSGGCARSPATTPCRCSPTPAARASWPACWPSGRTTAATATTGRDVCLIPSSAHGTNAASAVMAGMRVVVVACDDDGNVDLDDLRAKIAEHGDRLAAADGHLPVDPRRVRGGHRRDLRRRSTTPAGRCTSTAPTSTPWSAWPGPGRFGADVSHLNLHKTFCIPHGGGGPGVGPGRPCGRTWRPFLPNHPLVRRGRPGHRAPGPISARPVGLGRHPAHPVGLHPHDGRPTACGGPPRSPSSTPTTWPAGCADHYPVLYTGRGRPGRPRVHPRPPPAHQGHRRHRRRRRQAADRLRLPRPDHVLPGGRHPDGRAHRVRGPRRARPLLRRHDRHPGRDRRVPRGCCRERAAHRRRRLLVDEWDHPYTRERGRLPAARPARADKYWPPVRRIDGGHGDRNLVCACPPVEDLRRSRRTRRRVQPL